MSLNYVILSYRVMWRRNEFEPWNNTDFSKECDAFRFFKEVLSDNFECKLLEIKALESWCN